MKNFLLVALLGLEAAAYPGVMNSLPKQKSEFSKRQGLPSTQEAQALSKARTNCGPNPCLVFSATEQYVSTTGEHAYASPAAGDIRGPCPGLNAAANHAYLPRNGIADILETIDGLGEAYGMSVDLAGFLAAYAIIFDGDPLSGTWSIGGPLPQLLPIPGIGTPQGISYSHNVYEGDSSIGRNDAYLNNGDAHSLNVDRFAETYAIAVNDGSDRYTLDKFVQDFQKKADESESTNPYYFAAPFSTTLVSPAAYNFVINFMSNHSAEEPGGYLDGEMFKTFFAVTGDYPNFTWNRGQERIPDNWYRRTSTAQYSAVSVFEDLIVGWLAYPDTFRLGGNTNGPNTYVGIDLANFTGGAMGLDALLQPEGTNAACFYAQFIQAVIPDFANAGVAALSSVANLINNQIKPITGGADCPVVDEFDQSLFNQYPGHTYSPTGPATNYKYL